MVCRILGKVICATIGNDIQEAAEALQACAGQQAGCEAAVHAMRMIYEDPSDEAVLLVDVVLLQGEPKQASKACLPHHHIQTKP